MNETDYDYTCGYGTNLYIPESSRAHNVAIGHVCNILIQEKDVEQQDKDTILAVLLRVLGNVIGIKHQLDTRIAKVTLDTEQVEHHYFTMLCQQ